MKKLIFIFLSFFLYSSLIICQTKTEKEERITLSELPNEIKNIVENLPKTTKRLRFYKETDGSKRSFEVKLKNKGDYYSIEFSEFGILEDIEVISKFKTINERAKTEISSYFEKSFSKHKLIKLQKQYLFEANIEALKFIKIIISDNLKTPNNFEIIAEIKTSEKRALREFTFNSEGVFLKYRTINPISYGYVLY